MTAVNVRTPCEIIDEFHSQTHGDRGLSIFTKVKGSISFRISLNIDIRPKTACRALWKNNDRRKFTANCFLQKQLGSVDQLQLMIIVPPLSYSMQYED